MAFDPSSGRVHATVSISLQNTAPASGLPSYVIGSYPGSGLAPGTNLTWLSLYSPLGVVGATIDGRSLQLGSGIPELGVEAYSAYVKIPAESTEVLHISLQGNITSGDTYRQVVRLQPLANPVVMQTSVSAPAGWSLASDTPSAWTAGTDVVQAHGWTFRP